jgi:DNA-binding transcriptional MerR regulator
MPPTRNGVKHDPITNVIASILDEFNVEYREDPQHPIADLRQSQVRDEKNIAAKDTISVIASKIATGQPVPAIVVTSDGRIVDGNGRVHTAKKFKRGTLYALVTNKTEEQLGDTLLEILGSRLNDHGKRRAKHEIDKTIRKLLANGATTERIMEHVSVEAGRVRNMRAQIAGEERVETAGLTRNGFSLAHLKTFGRAELMDEPLNGVIRLAHDSGLSAGETGDLVKKLRAQGSEVEQVALLNQEREDLRERIDEHKRTGNGKPPAARRAKQSLSGFMGITNNPDELVERNPDRIASQLKTLRSAQALLNHIITMQEAEARRAGIELL